MLNRIRVRKATPVKGKFLLLLSFFFFISWWVCKKRSAEIGTPVPVCRCGDWWWWWRCDLFWSFFYVKMRHFFLSSITANNEFEVDLREEEEEEVELGDVHLMIWTTVCKYHLSSVLSTRSCLLASVSRHLTLPVSTYCTLKEVREREAGDGLRKKSVEECKYSKMIEWIRIWL